MKTFLSERNGSFALGTDGSLQVIGGGLATLQTSAQFARTRRGEMIHAMDQGIPFFSTVFNSSPNVIQFEASLRERLLEVPSVDAVVELDVQQIDDELTYTATLRERSGDEVLISG